MIKEITTNEEFQSAEEKLEVLKNKINEIIKVINGIKNKS